MCDTDHFLLPLAKSYRCQGMVTKTFLLTFSKNHIVKNHITPVLDLKHDLFKIKVSDEKDNFNESDRFRCDKCFVLLKDDQELNYHLAYEHKLIHEESKKLKTDVMDYYPMPFSRLGKELK